MDEELIWDTAWKWLCERRKNAPADADIWDLRFHRETEYPRIVNAVNELTYHLTPMLIYRRSKGDRLAQWSARDALVLKWAAIHAEKVLPVHSRCEHGRGNGGSIASVHRLHQILQAGEYKFVLRTDIRGYYRNIVKTQLWFQIQRYVVDSRVKEIIRQYLWYSIEDGGDIYTPSTGIPRGCALSPLLGASLLYHVDVRFSSVEDIYYARYMDDFMVLTRTRWRLRQCVAQLNDYFDMRGFEPHPDKTFIGRTARGFDWLGAVFNEHGAAGLAPRSITRHRERCLRLYEQACRLGLSHSEAMLKVQTYRERWGLWASRLLPDESQ
ncbi:transposase [Serratia marcescens]|nr:transposase [Serratia marcescens]